MSKQIATAILALGIALGPASALAQVVIRVGPPAPRHERIPPSPREHRDWAWRAGYHRWDGHAYVWTPGEYIAPPHPHAHWVPGHYDRRPGGYVYVEGHWR